VKYPGSPPGCRTAVRPVEGRSQEVVSKLSIGFEVKEGEEAKPEEYMEIFRGLRFKPDVEIGPEGRF